MEVSLQMQQNETTCEDKERKEKEWQESIKDQWVHQEDNSNWWHVLYLRRGARTGNMMDAQTFAQCVAKLRACLQLLPGTVSEMSVHNSTVRGTNWEYTVYICHLTSALSDTGRWSCLWFPVLQSSLFYWNISGDMGGYYCYYYYYVVLFFSSSSPLVLRSQDISAQCTFTKLRYWHVIGNLNLIKNLIKSLSVVCHDFTGPKTRERNWLSFLPGGKCLFKKPQTWTHEKHADEEVGVLQNSCDDVVVRCHSMKDPL